MVPMLTCGLVRSNFAFATGGPPSYSVRRPRGVRVRVGGGTGELLSAGLRNDLEGDILRDLRVRVELHRVAGPTLGLAAEVSDIAEHLREGHEGRDDPGPRTF